LSKISPYFPLWGKNPPPKNPPRETPKKKNKFWCGGVGLFPSQGPSFCFLAKYEQYTIFFSPTKSMFFFFHDYPVPLFFFQNLNWLRGPIVLVLATSLFFGSWTAAHRPELSDPVWFHSQHCHSASFFSGPLLDRTSQ